MSTSCMLTQTKKTINSNADTNAGSICPILELGIFSLTDDNHTTVPLPTEQSMSPITGVDFIKKSV